MRKIGLAAQRYNVADGNSDPYAVLDMPIASSKHFRAQVQSQRHSHQGTGFDAEEARVPAT
jgi:hypothetical protein